MAARKKREADPPTQLRELASALEAEGLGRGYVLRGDERFFRDKGVEMLKRRGVQEGYEVCVHDAERGNADFRLSALIDDLSGGGLFAARRLVIVRNGAEHLKKNGTKPSPLTSALLAFLEAPEDPGSFVLSLPSLRADHAVAKAVKQSSGRLCDLRKLYDSPPPWKPDPRQTELVLWTRERARKFGVRLSPDEAVYVAAAVGNDLFELDAQLERLKSLGGEDLRKVIGWTAAGTPWTVADQVVGGQAARALAGVEALFRAGFQEKGGRRLLDASALSTMLVSSITRSLRRSLALSLELSSGASEADAARAAGVAGRGAEEALRVARSQSPSVWRERLDQAADLERRAKTGVGLDANDFALLALRWA